MVFYSLLLKSIKQIYQKCFKSVSYASQIEVEQAEQTFYINYLREGMTVFDVGANVGEIALLFSRFVGSMGEVHAFEASRSTFEKLTQVCQLVGHSQIVLNNKAVADQEGISKLYVYDDNHSAWNSLADRPLHEYGIDVTPIRIEEVETVTIDGYCQENNISHIDLLKIDVEGAEYQVLLGCRQMLESQCIRCCVFEFGATTFDMGNSPNKIEDYLRHYGYQIWNVVKGNPVFPGRASAVEACFSVHVAIPKGIMQKVLWKL
jgi:FkbM family methyltransferase